MFLRWKSPVEIPYVDDALLTRWGYTSNEVILVCCIDGVQCIKKGFYSDIERDLKAQQSMLRRLWDQIGEIWLFFDVDQNTIMEGSEENWIKLDDAIRKINRMAGRKSIRIRLLMTTGCIEYWFLLHFEQVQPPYKTGPEFKKYIENRLKRHIPDYRKSDEQLIRKLAEEGFDQGLINGRWTIESLEKKGAITHGSEESRKRDHELFTCGMAFTTVHEAVQSLVNRADC